MIVKQINKLQMTKAKGVRKVGGTEVRQVLLHYQGRLHISSVEKLTQTFRTEIVLAYFVVIQIFFVILKSCIYNEATIVSVVHQGSRLC